MKSYLWLKASILAIICLILLSPCRATNIDELEEKVNDIIGELAKAERQLVQSKRQVSKNIFFQGDLTLGRFQGQSQGSLQKFNLQISAKPTEQVDFGVKLDFPFSMEPMAFASPEVDEIFINVKTNRLDCQVGTYWLKFSPLLLEGDYIDLTGVPSIYRLYPLHGLAQQTNKSGGIRYEGLYIDTNSDDLLSRLKVIAARLEKEGLVFTFGCEPSIKRGLAEFRATWLRQIHEGRGTDPHTEKNVLSGNFSLSTLIGKIDLEIAGSKFDPETRVGENSENLRIVEGKAWRAAWEFEKGSFLAGFNMQKQDQEFIPIAQRSLRPVFFVTDNENEFLPSGEIRSFHFGTKTNKGYKGIVNHQIETEDGVINTLTLKYERHILLGGNLAFRFMECQGWPLLEGKNREIVAGIDFPLSRQVYLLAGWEGALQEDIVATGYGLGMRVATTNQGGLLEFNWQRSVDSKEHFEFVAKVLF